MYISTSDNYNTCGSTITTANCYPTWYNGCATYNNTSCPQDKDELYLDRMVEGIHQTLQNEHCNKVTSEEFNKIIAPQLVEMQKLEVKFREIELRKTPWYKIDTSSQEKNELKLQAYTIVSKVNPYYSLNNVYSNFYWHKLELIEALRKKVLGDNSTPDKSQIRALLISTKDFNTKTFQELLDLTRNTFLNND